MAGIPLSHPEDHLLRRLTWYMKRERAKQLRETGKIEDAQACHHPEIEKERYDEGGHTGFYVCTTCGAYIGPEPEDPEEE